MECNGDDQDPLGERDKKLDWHGKLDCFQTETSWHGKIMDTILILQNKLTGMARRDNEIDRCSNEMFGALKRVDTSIDRCSNEILGKLEKIE